MRPAGFDSPACGQGPIAMPYDRNDDLPPSVRQHLPPGAQDIFREAFNRAFERYGEVPAFRIAWSAVKRRYEKVNGVWVSRWRA